MSRKSKVIFASLLIAIFIHALAAPRTLILVPFGDKLATVFVIEDTLIVNSSKEVLIVSKIMPTYMTRYAIDPETRLMYSIVSVETGKPYVRLTPQGKRTALFLLDRDIRSRKLFALGYEAQVLEVSDDYAVVYIPVLGKVKYERVNGEWWVDSINGRGVIRVPGDSFVIVFILIVIASALLLSTVNDILSLRLTTKLALMLQRT